MFYADDIFEWTDGQVDYLAVQLMLSINSRFVTRLMKMVTAMDEWLSGWHV